MSDAIVSDLVQRVGDLENPAESPRTTTLAVGTKQVNFKDEVLLVDQSASTTSSYTDSGSSKYIPDTAKEALLFVVIKDTINGAGLTTLWGRGNGVESRLCAIYEPTGPDFSSTGAQARVQVSRGRFDWKLEIAGGASSVGVLIYLTGYVE